MADTPLSFGTIITGVLGSMGLGGVFIKLLENRGSSTKATTDELALVRSDLWKKLDEMEAEHKLELSAMRAEHKAELSVLREQHFTEKERWEKKDAERDRAIWALQTKIRGMEGEMADRQRVFAGHRSMTRTMIWQAEREDPNWRRLAEVLKREGDADLFDVSFALNSMPEGEVPMTMPRHVLVVDDYEDGRHALAAQLKFLGYHTESAASAVEGMAKMERAKSADNPFDLVLLDHGMSNLDGGEMASILRVMGDETRIVFVTGHAMKGGDGELLINGQTAKEMGATAILQKPLDFSKLAETLAPFFEA